MNAPGRLGAVMYVVASVLAIALLTALFHDAIEHQRNPNESPQSVATDDGRVSIVLERNRSGHYVFDGFVNGAPVEFLLDTGSRSCCKPPAPSARRPVARGHGEWHHHGVCDNDRQPCRRRTRRNEHSREYRAEPARGTDPARHELSETLGFFPTRRYADFVATSATLRRGYGEGKSGSQPRKRKSISKWKQ